MTESNTQQERKTYIPFIGGLSDEEWSEIVALDYTLTWRYTDRYEEDLKRYQELSKKRWL